MSERMLAANERLRDPSRSRQRVERAPSFPDGNTDYEFKATGASPLPVFGWAHRQTTQSVLRDGTTVRYFKCLGLLRCPEADCSIRYRPLSTSKKPKGRRQTCRIHRVPMITVSCDCTWRYYLPRPSRHPKQPRARLSHSGQHDHAKPTAVKAAAESKEWLKAVVAVSAIQPTLLAMGSQSRPAAREVDAAWINRDVLAADRRNVCPLG